MGWGGRPGSACGENPKLPPAPQLGTCLLLSDFLTEAQGQSPVLSWDIQPHLCIFFPEAGMLKSAESPPSRAFMSSQGSLSQILGRSGEAGPQAS